MSGSVPLLPLFVYRDDFTFSLRNNRFRHSSKRFIQLGLSSANSADRLQFHLFRLAPFLYLTLSLADKRKTRTVISSVSLNAQETLCNETTAPSPRATYHLSVSPKETNEGKRKLAQYMCVWVIKINVLSARALESRAGTAFPHSFLKLYLSEQLDFRSLGIVAGFRKERKPF
jgi:hypothetical protein